MGASLSAKFRDCVAKAENASYPFGSRRETLALMGKYESWIKKNGRDLSIVILKYKDTRNPGSRDVVMFEFRVGSSRSRTPPTECQLIFPPHFPRVPPILAIKSAGLFDFENSRHFRHPLPTKSFEVKIETFFYKNSPDSIMLDFVSNITRDFPNTPQRTALTKPVVWPPVFDERYNDVETAFPFDFDFKAIQRASESDQGSQKLRSEYMADLDTLRENFFRLKMQPSPSSTLEAASNQSLALMKADITKVHATNQDLARKIEKFFDVPVEDILTKQQRSEEVECFELESKLIGIKETVWFIEEHFGDDLETEFIPVLAKLTELYGQEFEAARKAKGVPVVRRYFGREG